MQFISEFAPLHSGANRGSNQDQGLLHKGRHRSEKEGKHKCTGAQ